MREDFAVFILSHGRAGRIRTIDKLLECGYTGKYYVVIDNEDKTADEYYKLYGDKVLMFDKLAVSKTFDTFDTFKDRRTIVYARNVCFDLAEKLGLAYFLELDDDYTSFLYRRIVDGQFMSRNCKQLDHIFELMIEFLEDTKALTVAFAQGGDFIGGADSGTYAKKVLRKAMNTFFCKTSNRFQFVGRINEDVNTYCSLGSKGELLFTITDFMINQVQTQQNAGGMTSVYLDSGTYVKSFYTVITCPSFVTINRIVTSASNRIHHHIRWDYGVPKILNQKWKK